MKRLVLIGEGHGEVLALPILINKLLQEKSGSGLLYVDRNIIRTASSGLVKWDKQNNCCDYSQWVSRVTLASRRQNVGGIIAVIDGDFSQFPPGSGLPFCAATIAKNMAAEATSVRAGEVFSLSVVFACPEYETWLVAGAESLAGQKLKDGRFALPQGVKFPDGNPESHGKRWLEKNCINYRPARDQSALTELVDFQFIRAKKLRSFTRLDHAVNEMLEAVAKGRHVSTP